MKFLTDLENAITRAKVIASAVNTAISTAQTVEHLIPLSGAGADKLNFVMNTVHAIWAPIYTAVEGFDVVHLEDAIKSAVADFVSLQNALGNFTKGANAVPAGSTTLTIKTP